MEPAFAMVPIQTTPMATDPIPPAPRAAIECRRVRFRRPPRKSQGIAPCANIRMYKVCPTSSCPSANITAGINSVLLHGDVDAMNFSISGGTSPWTDNDRRFLDLVIRRHRGLRLRRQHQRRHAQSRRPCEPPWSLGHDGGRVHEGLSRSPVISWQASASAVRSRETYRI